MKLGTNERFSITSSNTITPFWEKWGDEVTGHFVDIGIEEFYDFNSCAIPLSSAIPSPSNPCKDARILINSVVYGNAPSDTNFNVVVKDQLGALVGSLIGGEWIVNTGGSCADATYTIEDSLGNVLYTGTIPSGGSVTEVIGNCTLNVNKSDGTLISSRSILAEGTDSYNVGDSSAVLKDESGNVLSTTPIKATESKDIVAPNGDVSVNSVAFDDVLSGGTLNIQVRKSTGNNLIGSKQGQYWRIGDSTITNSDSTYDVDVKATESLVLPDSQINVNSVDRGDVVSVKTIDVNLEDSVGDPVTPTSVGLVGNTLTIEVPSGVPDIDQTDTDVLGQLLLPTKPSERPTNYSMRALDWADDYISKLTAYTSAKENAIIDLVTSLDSAGLWAKMDYFYPMIGDNAVDNSLMLKYPRNAQGGNMMFSGSPTHGAGFIQSSGTSGILYPISYINFSQTDFSMGVYCLDTAWETGNGHPFGFATPFSNYCAIYLGEAGALAGLPYFANLGYSNRLTFSKSGIDAKGLFIGDVSASLRKISRNGITQASSAVNLGLLNSVAAIPHGLNFGGNTTKRFSLFFFGKSMDATQTSNFNTIIQQFMTDKGL
jgi:hypothetical protein